MLICAVAAGFEGLCAGRDPLAQLTALRQPPWSLPNWAWALVGIAWYAICFTAAVRLLPNWSDRPWPLLLLCALMLANGAANVLQFRMKRLDLALLFFGPYWMLLTAFLAAVHSLDSSIARLFEMYAAYQLYAAAWGYQLWRLNR